MLAMFNMYQMYIQFPRISADAEILVRMLVHFPIKTLMLFAAIGHTVTGAA